MLNYKAIVVTLLMLISPPLWAEQSDANQFIMECNHENDRCAEECSCQADTASEGYMNDSGEINIFDRQSLLNRVTEVDT